MSNHEPVDQASDPNAAEHERPQRVRVLKGAHAAFNEEYSSIPCKLRDISATGAYVVFEGGWFVPDRFMLHVDIDGYKIQCERVWQKGSECGVRFIGGKIVTGKGRQQVLTPMPPADASAQANDHTPVKPAYDGAASARPASKPRAGGFGRRTR